VGGKRYERDISYLPHPLCPPLPDVIGVVKGEGEDF
jgi:hypothetical protein